MNALDDAIIIANVVGAVYGIRQGALRMATTVVSLGAAIYLASIQYQTVGALAEHQFGIDPTEGSVAGYIIVFVVVFAAVQLIGSAAINLLHMVHMGFLDRLAGAVIGAGVASVIAGLAVMLMAAMLPTDAAILKESEVAPRLFAYNEALVQFIPEKAKLAYQENRDELMRNWTLKAERAAAPSPAPSPSSSAAK